MKQKKTKKQSAYTSPYLSYGSKPKKKTYYNKVGSFFVVLFLALFGLSYVWDLSFFDGVEAFVLAHATEASEGMSSEDTTKSMSNNASSTESLATSSEGEDAEEEMDYFSAEDILKEIDLEDVGETDDVAEGELSKSDWQIILVNKQHVIPDDYAFTLGNISTMKGTMQCDERIITELLQMLQAAADDGINLQICSPYRDSSRQEYLFSKKITTYMKLGQSYMEAYANAAQAVTIPGSSEHQIGLALDIISSTYTSLDEGFGDTAAGQWLAQNSYLYGFVLRYPKGKEYITGIEYEPWHFRYVGKTAAKLMYEEDLTLEELWDRLDN